MTGTEFDEPLARKVLAQIEALQADWRTYALGRTPQSRPLETWDQGVWRRVVPAKDNVRGSCGSAMCFAGWAGELVGEWLLSPQEILDLRVMTVPGGRALTELVVAGEATRRETLPLAYWLQEMKDRIRDEWLLTSSLEEVTERAERTEKLLLSRHSEATRVLPVASWAAWRLGLGEDPMSMFSSNQQLDDLRFIVDIYSRYGTDLEEIRPHLTPAERERYLDEPADAAENG